MAVSDGYRWSKVIFIVYWWIGHWWYLSMISNFLFALYIATTTIYLSALIGSISRWLGPCIALCMLSVSVSPKQSVSVPAPLGIPTSGRCLGFDADTYISYDGPSLRETMTTRKLCPDNLTPGTGAFLTSTCEYAIEYAYGLRDGSRICVTPSHDLCIDVTGYIPGDGLYFDANSDDSHTSIKVCHVYVWMLMTIHKRYSTRNFPCH